METKNCKQVSKRFWLVSSNLENLNFLRKPELLSKAVMESSIDETIVVEKGSMDIFEVIVLNFGSDYYKYMYTFFRGARKRKYFNSLN